MLAGRDTDLVTGRDRTGEPRARPADLSEIMDRLMALELEEVADAFGALADRQPEALIALLGPEASWVECVGTRITSTTHGAANLAELLRRRLAGGRPVAVTGIVKDRAALEVGYSEPWWLARRGVTARLVYHLLGDARQIVTVGDRIDAIESRAVLFAPRAFETLEPAQSDLASLLRG